MQYIQKKVMPPQQWDTWFTTATGARSYNYDADCGQMRNLPQAKQYLIDEQHGLCAYCQQRISKENASIEHVIPKERNIELSTSYYNLVAVCKNPPKDEDGKLHCDKEKMSQLITPFIFLSDSEAGPTFNNAYFRVGMDSRVFPKDGLSLSHRQQAEAFINILNLNHSALVANRSKNVIDGILSACKGLDKQGKRNVLRKSFERILLQRNTPYRQYALAFLGNRLGY